jgi:hypothetical protein
MRILAVLLLCGSCSIARAQFDEDGECQNAKAQEKSARNDLQPLLKQYQQCVQKGGDETCSADFEHLRTAQSSYREAVEHRQQACAY